MLDNLALFLKIIEKGGLSAAGRELGLSPATVSERLAALEAQYGVTLLTRTTRSISLTDEGRMLAEGARNLLAEADELKTRLGRGAAAIAGSVRLTATVDLGKTCIVPIVDRFLAEHPQVSVDLHLSDGFVDLVSQGVDFGVRYGALADSSLRARPIGESRRIVCASPDFLARFGTPKHPDDLQRFDCIVMQFGNFTDRIWTFQAKDKPHHVAVSGRRTTNNGELARLWCLQGHGLAFKSQWDVRNELESGRLIEVLADYTTSSMPLQIVYPASQALPRRVRALMDAIADGLASHACKRAGG